MVSDQQKGAAHEKVIIKLIWDPCGYSARGADLMQLNCIVCHFHIEEKTQFFVFAIIDNLNSEFSSASGP
jgi:hypothetical protein